MDFWENKYVLYIGIPVGVLVIAFILSRILRFLLNRWLKKTSAFLKIDRTKYNFLKNAVSSVIYLTAVIIIFYTIPQLRTISITLFAGAGIFAAILGFASQQAFSNIISGIFIVIFKPFRVGDIITLSGGHLGVVEDITLRHTVIRNFENRRIIIPNSTISSETILNSTIGDEKICAYIEMSISYDSDIEKAMNIIREEAQKHPGFLDHRTEEDKASGEPPVAVRLISFGDSSVNLRGYVWAANPMAAFIMKCDLHKSIKERFDNEGIEIPFPYRTVVFKNKKDE